MEGHPYHIVSECRVRDILVYDIMASEQVQKPFQDEYHTLDKQGDRCDNSHYRNSIAWKRTLHGAFPRCPNTINLWKNRKYSLQILEQLLGMTF